MTLAAGRKLGPYTVEALLGAGGMGEVYRARDTRLERTVAIKVLPERLSRDARLRERLEREAKAVSSLQHPHICTLFDIGTEGETTFLVLEHLEGESLSDRLKHGPLSVDEAIRYGEQIADALDGAHGKGVVHRDLKPGNVMLTASGVKLLDFGLAKVPEETDHSSTDSNSPTVQKPLTEEGSLLGTVPYMAPEQLEGKHVDARADLFAFGAVLYEMLTGRRAFEGDSQASVIAAIMSSEPWRIGDVRADVPPLLELVLKRCLAKAPEERFQTSRDLAGSIAWAREPLASKKASVTSTAASRRPWPRLAAAALVTLAALALGFVVARSRAPEPMGPLRATIPVPALRVRFEGRPFDVSPGGRRIALISDTESGNFGRVYVRDLDSFELTPITGTVNALTTTFFSPDGREVAYESLFSTLSTASVDGRSPTSMTGPDDNMLGVAWLHDGSFVYGSATGLWRLSLNDDAPPEKWTELGAGEIRHRAPQRLPEDSGVLFTVDGETTSVAVLPAGATHHRILTPGDSPFYVRTGHIVFASAAGEIMAAPFDLATLELTAAPVALPDRVAMRPEYLYAPMAVGIEGTLIYLDVVENLRTTVWVDRNGETSPVLDHGFHSVSLSPAGTRFAADEGDAGRLWVYDILRGTRVLIAETGTIQARFTPDGSEVVYRSSEARSMQIRASDGSGEARALLEGPGVSPLSWSPDGQYLLYFSAPGDVLVLSATGDVFPFADTDADENAAAFSPDGNWVAYQSNESGRAEVYVKPFPGPGPKTTISPNGGKAPCWSHDGSELFYRQGTAMMAVAVTTNPTFVAGAPVQLFDGPFHADATGHPSYDVARDGRFLMMLNESEQVNELRVVVNLAAELEAIDFTGGR